MSSCNENCVYADKKRISFVHALQKNRFVENQARISETTPSKATRYHKIRQTRLTVFFPFR